MPGDESLKPRLDAFERIVRRGGRQMDGAGFVAPDQAVFGGERKLHRIEQRIGGEQGPAGHYAEGALARSIELQQKIGDMGFEGGAIRRIFDGDERSIHIQKERGL